MKEEEETLLANEVSKALVLKRPRDMPSEYESHQEEVAEIRESKKAKSYDLDWRLVEKYGLRRQQTSLIITLIRWMWKWERTQRLMG